MLVYFEQMKGKTKGIASRTICRPKVLNKKTQPTV